MQKTVSVCVQQGTMRTVWWLLFVVVAYKIASVEVKGNIVECLHIFYAILHTGLRLL